MTKPTSDESRAGAKRQPLGFTIPSLARHLGVSASTIRLAVKRGEIDTVRFGGLERISPSEAERLAKSFNLKGHKSDGPAPATQAAPAPSPVVEDEKLARMEARIRVLERYVAAIHTDLVTLRGDVRDQPTS